MHKTEINILISALHILSEQIESGDGVANAAIFEGAERLQELHDEVTRLTELNASLIQTLEMKE